MKVHIGKKIKEVYEAKGMKLSAFAKRIGTVRQNVYKIFTREDINTDLLRRISQALEHDFFQYLIPPNEVHDPPSPYGKKQQAHYESKLEKLSREVERLKNELELRDKMIRLLEEKLKNKA